LEDIRYLNDSFKWINEKDTVAACSPAATSTDAFNRNEKLAGGVDRGYFALNAGNAGSNPALGASSSRLMGKDT
jgi:hypothetical protein